MSKPKIPNQRKANIKHKKRVEKYASQIKVIYDRMAEESARLASLSDPDTSKPFNFADYPLTKNNIKKLQQQLYNDVSAVIMSGASEEWKESNLVQNLVVKRVLTAYTGTYKNGEEYTRYYQTNSDALKAFQIRKESGMNLSDRVWNLSEEYRVELEDAISAAIAPGISAQELSMEVRKYLNEPDLMFRRFRYKNEQGEWKRKWKKRYTDDEGNVRFIDCNRDSYRNQWTGPGYYKSSAKNAMRLARTEINMAYRTAEQERWKQFDFVVGYEVKTTQNGHHVEDICNRLAGKYPKDFKFTGWHPQCMCYCIPILKTEEEFWSLDVDKQSVNAVTYVPDNFKQWITDNSDRIEKAMERGTLPYFIKDNRKVVDGILNGKTAENAVSGMQNAVINTKSGSIPTKKHISDENHHLTQGEVRNPLSDEIKKRREEIREEARNTIAGTPIYLPVLDQTAIVSNKGIKEWLNQPHAHIAEKNELILDIQNVLEKAKYIGSGSDKHDAQARVHLYEIEILGEKSWIIIRALHNGEYKIHSITDCSDIKIKIFGKNKEP